VTEVRLSVAIMAHPSRETAARALSAALSATIVWDEGNGEADTGYRALAASEPGATHHLVVQDDAEPVDGFLEHARRAIAAYPEFLVSFYLGAGLPFWPQERLAVATAKADRLGTAWIATNYAHGVALAVPTFDIPGLRGWYYTGEAQRHLYDQRVAHYFLRRGQPVMNAWPSLVEHGDGPSLVSPQGGKGLPDRKAWRVAVRDSYDTPVTFM
jgi:hypothetical protein